MRLYLFHCLGQRVHGLENIDTKMEGLCCKQNLVFDIILAGNKERSKMVINNALGLTMNRYYCHRACRVVSLMHNYCPVCACAGRKNGGRAEEGSRETEPVF